VATYLLRMLSLDETGIAAAPVEIPPLVDAADVAALTDEEAEAQLLAELQRSARGSTHG